MLTIVPNLPDNTLGFSAKGKVTAEDYKKVLIPAVEAELKENSKIRFYYELGQDFDGYELAAMWEDLIFGMGHLKNWEKIAVVTDTEWIVHGIHAFRFLLPCPLRVFSLDQAQEAKRWLND